MTNTKERKQSVRTSVSIPPEDHKDLQRIADEKKVSVAWVIREAIERYLKAEAPLFRSK